MPRLSLLAAVAAAAAIGLTAAPPALAAQQCSTGDAVTAAQVLFGEGTEVVKTERVAGLQTALVLEPYIAPGTRHRLVQGGGQWCSAETGLNRAWLASGRRVGDGRALAAAYARLAAAPYFDGTTVERHTTVAGVHTISTHARTNGVTAAWVVRTDAQGVRSAAWTSTGFGVKPLEAQVEGLTALAGAKETYTRSASGLLRAQRGLPTRADLAVEAPSATLSHVTPDGFTIHVVAGDTRQMPDVGQDAGSYEVDRRTLRAIRRMVAENYEEFHGWGFRANWAVPRTRPVLLNSPVQVPAAAKTGYVYMNDGTSAYCLACVFIADDFQIHMLSDFAVALEALGYTYPAGKEYEVYSDILGHEMFHNWQNNYYRPGEGNSTPGSYSEGTARFQETLHEYSEASHQDGSLIYANDANGCNGGLGTAPDAGLANGLFQTQVYTACQFWLPWYASAGPQAFAKLVTQGMPAAAKPAGEDEDPLNNAGKVIKAIELATGRPYAESAAAFAGAIITGENMVYGSFLEGGLAPRDWGRFLERWRPAALAAGGSTGRTLANGGLLGVEVTQAVRPTVDGDAVLAVVRDTPTGVTTSTPPEGELVPGPAAGERVYLLAVRAAQGAAAVTLTAGR